jgi:sulfite reductase beta subunit-like hemoprotein
MRSYGGSMAPDIPAAKRSGLTVDFARLTEEGDCWLSDEDRYALKTHGVCTQLQQGVFMIRLRVTGGVLATQQARGLAAVARRQGHDWIHLTTRQNVELHWVEARRVESTLRALGRVGLSTRSSCGHTLRNVVCSEEAGVGLDEPFDCFPDASRVSAAIIARSATLNCELPSRVNMSFGGSARCREDARINDAGFVSVVRHGVCGYELWAGGSLGKSPRLGILLCDFVDRRDVLAAAEALVDVFVTHGAFDTPTKGRMKFVVDSLGEGAFRAAWHEAFAEARTRVHQSPQQIELLDEVDRAAVLRRMPHGGWSVGVRPQRVAGMSSVTIAIPLGDLSSSELGLFADLADRYGDRFLTITRDQDITLRNVAVEHVPMIREAIAPRGLGLVSERPGALLRACTGAAVCALGITHAPEGAKQLADLVSLARNSSLRVHVSGCPNSCAQHQVADIGLAGTRLRVNGRTTDGYQLFVGLDPDAGEVGEVIGRVAEQDLPAAIDADVGVWESTRAAGETIGRTSRRVGLDAFAAYVAAVLEHRWATASQELVAHAAS